VIGAAIHSCPAAAEEGPSFGSAVVLVASSRAAPWQQAATMAELFRLEIH
jgi:hypothetical protein